MAGGDSGAIRRWALRRAALALRDKSRTIATAGTSLLPREAESDAAGTRCETLVASMTVFRRPPTRLPTILVEQVEGVRGSALNSFSSSATSRQAMGRNDLGAEQEVAPKAKEWTCRGQTGARQTPHEDEVRAPVVRFSQSAHPLPPLVN